ncbi:MAG: hypothetical protein KDC69_10575 [Flavobacteriaceae bacterium]|nr:hypothetical protein [Flavobacteriaceae bacterium]MCB0706434.1 hypothetical protein [Saprospiraceae bacterium]
MDKQSSKNNILRFLFLLNGALFILGGIGLLQDEKIILAIFQLLAAALNIGMFANFKRQKNKKSLELAILGMNIIVALSIGFDYLFSGKSYIQYAWFLVAIITVFVFIKIAGKPSDLTSDKLNG